MCNFCLLFDFSTARARTENGKAWIEKAPTDIPFLPKQQFAFCPVCGNPLKGDSVSSERFAESIKRIRRMRGLTQEALGEMIGVKKSAISKYEKGRSFPTVTQLVKLCQVLEISPQELM